MRNYGATLINKLLWKVVCWKLSTELFQSSTNQIIIFFCSVFWKQSLVTKWKTFYLQEMNTNHNLTLLVGCFFSLLWNSETCLSWGVECYLKFWFQKRESVSISFHFRQVFHIVGSNLSCFEKSIRLHWWAPADLCFFLSSIICS
jgi:hypothetical protein